MIASHQAWGPAFSAENEDAPGSHPPPLPGDPIETLRPQRRHYALVVDDAEDTRYAYQRYLEFNGLRAETASDGAAALALIAKEPPDVILLDLAMPRVTGWEVLQRLKQNAATRRIPVIVVSAQAEKTSAILAGADSYFEKPCLPEQVLLEVRRLLGRTKRSDSR